jgi:DNA-binding NtrC family response regulator
MKDKLQILHFWTDPGDAERLIRELAATGVEFEARLVKTLAEYVSALVRGKFALIIADARAETAGAGAEDVSLYRIAQEISPGTPFVLLCDPTDQARETGEKANNFSFMSPKDLHRLKSVINRALSSSDTDESR